MKEILKGELVRLSEVDPEEHGKAYAVWNRDTEFKRLLDTSTRLHSAKSSIDFFKKLVGETAPESYFFSIRAVEDNRLLGDIGLDVVNGWIGRNAFVGIGIGDRKDWGRGYGTQAMQLLLRYAFT